MKRARRRSRQGSAILSGMRVPAVAAALAALFLALPASAYKVETLDGRSLEAEALFRVGEGFVLRTAQGPVELPPGSIDFYATFRANLKDGRSNALAFKQGGVLRFESLEFADGRITILLSEDLAFTVSESVVDFRATVLEIGVLELPADFGGEASVAKSTGRGEGRPARTRRSGR